MKASNMILKTEKIHNQEKLILILKNQLETATNELAKLVHTDSQIASKVAELESLLNQHPEYKSVVSVRLAQLQTTPEPTPAPVRIEIEEIEEIEVVERTEALAFETQSAPTPEPVVETKPEPKNYTETEINEAYDSLFGFDRVSPQVEDTITETAPESITEPQPEASETEEIYQELKAESLKERMLACTTKKQLEELKSEIGAEASTKIWELCTIPERNYIKCISKATDPQKFPAVLGYRFHYTAPITKIEYDAIYLGYYLYGESLEDDKRAVLVESQPIICDKSDLRPFPNKQQPVLNPEERDRLEQIISLPQPQPEVESSSENPTAEEIAALEFTGLAPAPKHENGSQSGNKPDSNQSSEVAEKGDLIEVSDPESGLNGKIVEVEYPIRGGAVCCFWEGRSYCIPKNGYSIFQKNILNSPKV